MTIFLQTSSTGGPSSACFSAEAICCSVNLLLFTAWLLFYGGIMPEFLFLNGTIYWGRVTPHIRVRSDNDRHRGVQESGRFYSLRRIFASLAGPRRQTIDVRRGIETNTLFSQASSLGFSVAYALLQHSQVIVERWSDGHCGEEQGRRRRRGGTRPGLDNGCYEVCRHWRCRCAAHRHQRRGLGLHDHQSLRGQGRHRRLGCFFWFVGVGAAVGCLVAVLLFFCFVVRG